MFNIWGNKALKKAGNVPKEGISIKKWEFCIIWFATKLTVA